MKGEDMDSGFNEIFDGMDDNRRPRRRRRTGRRALAVCGVLVLLLVAGIGGFVWYLGHSFDDRAHRLSDADVFGGPPPDPGDGPMNVLLLGADEPMDRASVADARGLRSDTILVAHIPADRRSIELLSIPRDSWVDVAGHGKAKINAALSFGGLPLAVTTVSDFIGAPIHHVAIIDFEGFVRLTDALGGVDVESPEAFTGKNNTTFVKGINHLDGEAALAFVRERYSFADGDLQRGRNQQAYLSALFDSLTSAGTLANPVKVSGLVKTFAPYMYVDERLDAARIGALAMSLRSVSGGDVISFTAPISGDGRSADGQLYLRVDEAELAKMQAAFRNNTVREYAVGAKRQQL